MVVPSPATSLVLVDTSRTNCAPIFSNGSSSSISLAMDTPSLVISGVPNFLSSTTLRPLGPRVTFTVSASWLTPASNALRASSPRLMILAILIASYKKIRLQIKSACDGRAAAKILPGPPTSAAADRERDAIGGIPRHRFTRRLPECRPDER